MQRKAVQHRLGAALQEQLQLGVFGLFELFGFAVTQQAAGNRFLSGALRVVHGAGIVHDTLLAAAEYGAPC